MPPKISKRYLAAFLCTFTITVVLDGKPNRIAVRANASPEYLAERASDKSNKKQSYHFIKGIYFDGNIDDPGLDSVSFEEVTEEIALNLQKQDYYPESDPDEGDLLIMVHYGATNLQDLFDELPEYESYVDTGKIDSETDSWRDYPLTEKALPKFWAAGPRYRRSYRNKYLRASLLGMEDVFSWSLSSYEAYILEGMVAERRYFFVLTAFDLPLLRHGEKKVLWTTRYSVRSIGQSFDEAVRELNLVAGNYFGRDFDNLIHQRAMDPSVVEVGEIEVIGEEESQ